MREFCFGFGVALLAALSWTVQAQAPVYKCIDAKGKSTYQDFPCSQQQGISTRIESQPQGQALSAGAPVSEKTPMVRQLDSAVQAAISRQDFAKARSLALTQEHWQWIAEAERENRSNPVVVGRTEADLRSERSSTRACQDARRSYELESRSPQETEKRKQLMYEACGMEAPTITTTETVETVIVHRRPAVGYPPGSVHPSAPQYRPQQRVPRRPVYEETQPSGGIPSRGRDR